MNPRVTVQPLESCTRVKYLLFLDVRSRHGSVLPGGHCYCSYTYSLLLLIAVDLVINNLEYLDCGQK